MMLDTPPQNVNVTVDTIEDGQARQIALQKLSSMYQGYSFTFISANIINNKWVGMYSINNSDNQSNSNDEYNQLSQNDFNKSVYIPKSIVLFTIENKKLSNPEKPFKHDNPIIIPMRADSEDESIINQKLLPILNGNGVLNSGKLYFKYRGNTFAFWDKDNNKLDIAQGNNLIQCDIDKNGVSTSENNSNTNNDNVGVINDGSNYDANLEKELLNTFDNEKNNSKPKEVIELTRKDIVDCLKND